MTTLNPQQKEAVYSDANKIVCLAGAGAGKTFSMLARIEHIIKDLHVNPKSILQNSIHFMHSVIIFLLKILR